MSRLLMKVLTVMLSLMLVPNVMAENKVEVPYEKFDQDKFRSFLREYLFRSYTDENGVHIESVLSALGALSGFSLQQGIREDLIIKGGNEEGKVFTIIETKDGNKYFFGSIFDEPLYDTREGQISVWSLVGGGAQKAGASSLPDVSALAKANASAIGNEDYGNLTVPLMNQPIDHPIDAIKKHWDFTKKILQAKGAEPLFWSWEIALVAQDIIIAGKSVIDPKLAAQIVMEPAISMSKIDPSKIN